MDDSRNKHSDGSPSARTAAQKRARDAIDLADARPENKKVASVRGPRTWLEKLRAKAESGDPEAMCRLGVRHKVGIGLPKDEVQARWWFERSAAARDPKGMACFGRWLLLGIGGPQDNALGLVNLMDSAHLGSDLGTYTLAIAFLRGHYGLPKDRGRGWCWLKKVVHGKCAIKHLSDKGRADAMRLFRQLRRELARLKSARRRDALKALFKPLPQEIEEKIYSYMRARIGGNQEE